MFVLYADKNQLEVREKEPLTSGSVNVCPAKFEFSSDWEGLEKTVVFRAGTESRTVELDGAGETTVPWEVLRMPGRLLMAGVYGKRGESLVLPTVWASLGMILEGVSPGETSRPPTPELWERELERKGDTLGYTEEGDLGLYAGDRLLSNLPVRGGGSDDGLPSGVIVIWSGSSGSIPTGWALCDGNNGTPDLRHRFVYGAEASYGSVLMFTSNSAGVNSAAASIEITLKKAVEKLVFHYDVSTEARYDKFSASLGGTSLAAGISGTAVDDVDCGAVQAGTVLSCTYKKDSSGNSGRDNVMFCLMVQETAGSDLVYVDENNCGDFITVADGSPYTFEAVSQEVNPDAMISGSSGGAETVPITMDNMPRHSHVQKVGLDGNTLRFAAESGSSSVTNPGAYAALTESAVAALDDAKTYVAVITDNAGGDTPISILPPYYALCYIMKL